MADTLTHSPPPRLSNTYRDLLNRPVMILVAGVLGLAVAMKAVDSPIQSEPFKLFSPAVQAVAIQTEALVALWLLTGWARQTARLAAVALFALLAGASLAMAMSGVKDCGCFGAVAVNPWLTFVLDLGCVAMLLLTQPDGWIRNLRAPALVVGGLGLVAITAVCVVSSPMGQSALATFRGQGIQLVNPVINIGEGTAGSTGAARFELTNHTNSDIEMIGGALRCSCLTTDTLHFTIPAHATTSLTIQVIYKSTPGPFDLDFELFAAGGGRLKIPGRITGTVVE